MPRKCQKGKLIIEEKQKERLKELSNSRKAPIREVERAKILLLYLEETPINEIEKIAQVSIPTIYKCIEKALSMGIEAGLKRQISSPQRTCDYPGSKGPG